MSKKEEENRRAFLKRLARYGWTAPVILTVMQSEARACLSGYPAGDDGPPQPRCRPRDKKKPRWWWRLFGE